MDADDYFQKTIFTTKVISFDCDQVLVDTKSSLAEYYTEIVNPGAKIPKGSYSFDWGIFKDKKEHDDFISAWTHSEYFMNIPLLGDDWNPIEHKLGRDFLSSAEYARKLKNDGCPLYVVSSISNDPIIKKRRQDFIHKTFGRDLFKKIICLPLGAPKTETLKNIGAYIHIDDSKKHLLEAKDAGCIPLVFSDKMTNKELESVGWHTSSYRVLYEHIYSLLTRESK